jgi:hypothetical protein
MKSKEIFALIIRVIGVLGLAFIVHHIGGDIHSGIRLLNVDYVAKKGVLVLLGIYFVWGAPHLVKFAYSGDSCCEGEKPAEKP